MAPSPACKTLLGTQQYLLDEWAHSPMSGVTQGSLGIFGLPSTAPFYVRPTGQVGKLRVCSSSCLA